MAESNDPSQNDTQASRRFAPLPFQRYSAEESERRAGSFLATMRERRSVREYASEPIPMEAVRRCIETAAQAPSGAHKQPWTFVLIQDPALKTQIREAAEEEERAFYNGRAPEGWLEDLAPFGTGPEKPFLEEAPALIVVFAQRTGAEGQRHYYVNESVGIATGMLLAALHNAGFATLTHTPSPMKFLSELLGRPANERPYLLIPVGYPAKDCEVPAIVRKDRRDYLIER